MKEENYAVSRNYKEYLEKLMAIQETESPVAHIKKHEIIKGNAPEELKKYLDRNPQTIVAMAYFDFDLYEPTKECLKLIKDRLTKGSVLAFDELNESDCPGETLAFKEVFDLDRYSIMRFPYNSRTSYLVID